MDGFLFNFHISLTKPRVLEGVLAKVDRAANDVRGKAVMGYATEVLFSLGDFASKTGLFVSGEVVQTLAEAVEKSVVRIFEARE